MTISFVPIELGWTSLEFVLLDEFFIKRESGLIEQGNADFISAVAAGRSEPATKGSLYW